MLRSAENTLARLRENVTGHGFAATWLRSKPGRDACEIDLVFLAVRNVPVSRGTAVSLNLGLREERTGSASSYR